MKEQPVSLLNLGYLVVKSGFMGHAHERHCYRLKNADACRDRQQVLVGFWSSTVMSCYVWCVSTDLSAELPRLILSNPFEHLAHRNLSERSMGKIRFTFYKNSQTKDHYANHFLSINTGTVIFQECTVTQLNHSGDSHNQAEGKKLT